KDSGYARTLQNFGDCQLHIEWATPTPAHGEGQGRGNSGVFFGLDRYEVQLLDSFETKTYADGSAGAIYGQYPPLVNVSRPPGKKEFTLPIKLLDNYAGKYDRIEVTREGNQLAAATGSVRFTLFAESPTKFFAKTTDLQIEFPAADHGKPDHLTWSVGEGANE